MSAELPADTPFVVVGAGAVGSYFGGVLARAGIPVTLIGRPAHVEAIREHGLLLDTLHGRERVRVAAEMELSAARGARVVLFCVKTVDTESVARELAPYLSPGAAVLSLQNGVDNVARMKQVAGIDALAAVVYVAASVPGPGHVRHSARGDLVVGDALADTGTKSERRPLLEQLANRFRAASIPCRVSDDIRPELWLKLVMNCAYNAVSALGRSNYGRMVGDSGVRDLMRAIVEETLAVASRTGVILDAAAVHASVLELGGVMQEATSSMAQDLDRGRRTEIEALNGFIAREGARLGIAVPVNTALAALIRLRELA